MRYDETGKASRRLGNGGNVCIEAQLSVDSGEELETLFGEFRSKVFNVGALRKIECLFHLLLSRGSGDKADFYKVVLVGICVRVDNLFTVLIHIRDASALGRTRSSPTRRAVAGCGAGRASGRRRCSGLVVPETRDSHFALCFIDRDMDLVGANGGLVKIGSRGKACEKTSCSDLVTGVSEGAE